MIILINFPIFSNGFNTNYNNLYVLKSKKECAPPLTRANLVKELEKLNAKKIANVAIAQAIMESGFGTSELYKKTNNLFGMTLTPYIWGNRLDTSYNVLIDGQLYKFAMYKDWTYSLKDYVCWLDNNWLSDMKIIEHTSQKYCPDKGYKENLITILKQLK